MCTFWSKPLDLAKVDFTQCQRTVCEVLTAINASVKWNASLSLSALQNTHNVQRLTSYNAAQTTFAGDNVKSMTWSETPQQ